MALTLSPPQSEVLEVLSYAEEQQEIEEITVVQFEEMEELEIAEPIARAEAVQLVSDVISYDPADLDSLTEAPTIASEFEAFDSMFAEGQFADIGDLVGEDEALFFGTKAVARRIIFIVDNSNSMNGGRLETALIALQESIDALSTKQKFYIIFYSDTAYPLFHPNPASDLLPGTDANKKKVRQWLQTIEMCLRTDITDAINIAREMRPDLIYILGDGAFKTGALTNNPLKGVTIHTLGMNVAAKDQDGFRLIADLHNGEYTDVGITNAGLALFKQEGTRRRNNKRGPVWGLKLKK